MTRWSYRAARPCCSPGYSKGSTQRCCSYRHCRRGQRKRKVTGWLTASPSPTFSTRGGNWRFHSKKTQKTRVQSREERGKAGVVKTKRLFTLRSILTVRRHVLAIRTTD